MKRQIFKSLLLIIFFIVDSSAQSNIEQTHFLIGTWKVENKNIYENWTQNSNTLIGKSYSLNNNEKIVSETLSITSTNKTIIYTATVINQNNGKGVDFKLNNTIKDKFSFENLNHDFPKKIQYTILNKSELFVEVLGENNQGFSYKMIKQDFVQERD
ncbi:DUF6265 family protein [Ichthyenterobacterium magnum]|uniref:DUF6265 domain-containing protein n=1 Tax=Ichthyenterobacterium magnum TaxID=1230530 RepID=A0A420DKP6_9FLAO|nr:DUF6265 family protein [Ichthyenterobacterium magnum]RKE94789.1 hypothetical protein BXY80_1801 [Ichthyenterobacterium magnum]